MPNLFSPLTVGAVRLANRIAMPPMAQEAAGLDGAPTDRHVDHYFARASRKVGLVVVEHAFVAPGGRHSPGQLGIHQDSLMPAYARLVEALRPTGVVVALQISHAGAAANPQLTGDSPVAPSALPLPRQGATVPRALAVAELGGLAAAFARAAGRARQAGFDAVEVHGAHGFLLSQFLSPLINHRDDDYGGSLTGRARFPLEVVRAVRESVGASFPLFYRLGMADSLAGNEGLTLDDGLTVAGWLVEAGVDLLDISGGLGGARPGGSAAGYFLPWAARARARVSVPVLVAGGITDPFQADQAVRTGMTDLVGVGRGLLADPGWAEKAQQALGGSE
ncbi:MAG: NADH:flavin oxidoreductase [bacterium]|nr:NADH:flavin oxidoreductase [bacterium]